MLRWALKGFRVLHQAQELGGIGFPIEQGLGRKGSAPKSAAVMTMAERGDDPFEGNASHVDIWQP